MAKKLRNEVAVLRKAPRILMEDAIRRGIVEFEPTDSNDRNIGYACRLLVHDMRIGGSFLSRAGKTMRAGRGGLLDRAVSELASAGLGEVISQCECE